MKNIAKILVLYVLVLCSCSGDILTEDPKSFLTPESFPNNEKDAVAATNAAYSRLHSNNRDLYYGFVGTDEAFQGFHNQRPITWFINLNEFDDDAVGFWRTDYQGVARCNAVIDLVPNVDMDEALKNRLIAEAKFLRAYYYFSLVRKYGGVPIIDGILSGPDELVGVTRNTEQEVYQLIKQDLGDAVQSLPESYGSGELGRATKWAAIGMLAKVHMTLGEFDQANTFLDQIINSNQFGLFSDYNRIFREVNENQMFPDKNGNLVNEIIWEVQFVKNERGSTITQQTGSRDPQVGGVNALWGGFENMLPTPELRAMFEPGDLRLDISYVETVQINGQTEVLESNRTPEAGPISGKYHNPDNSEPPIRDESGNNIIILRFADILLLKAEALNELGNPEAALPYINLVRERAGITMLSGMDQNGLRQAIIKERATELSFEGHRRYDLIRWGIYIETMRNTTSPFLQSPRENIQEFHVRLPIPQNEIGVSNGSLTQNPGY
ncbi:RagB/SusD family nutrient uptake outer membrane protein [Flagellimonas marinaquae]|uniref:RagB/SusD family nutrient uptake outer membrane protein n=1 Tax=Flagellimonas marinaquae TaxID=254955 RepID=UPI000F8CB06D|nr:RagB/SusD family nutrient uptake outer membrane protein [Allomuricauda aquimarina]